MKHLFKSLPASLMAPDFQQYAQSLCEDINAFLASKGKDPDRVVCLVDFMRKKELALEYIFLAGDQGLTPIGIDNFIEDDWLAGYWAWIEDGGSNGILKNLDLDAPQRTLVLLDLIQSGVSGVYRSMGLKRCPESFEITVSFCRHMMSAATKDEVDDAVGNGVYYARMAVACLGKFLQTRHYREGHRVQSYEPDDVLLIVGKHQELFEREFFSQQQDVYLKDHPKLDGLYLEDEPERQGLNMVETLEELYKRVIADDSDLYGRLSKVRLAGQMLQPVIGSLLYDTLREGHAENVWRVALGRCTLLASYFPTRQVSAQYISASIALMLVRGVEADTGLDLPDQKMLLGVEQSLAKRWIEYSDSDREAIMAVLSTIACGSKLPLLAPSPELKASLDRFDILLNKDESSEVREAELQAFVAQDLAGPKRRLLWPTLIAHSRGITYDNVLQPLQPFLAVAWHWGQTFHYMGSSTQLYGEKIIGHDGWKRILANDPAMTAQALTLAREEQMLDLHYAASLSVTGEVLRKLKFELPAGLADHAISVDLGL